MTFVIDIQEDCYKLTKKETGVFIAYESPHVLNWWLTETGKLAVNSKTQEIIQEWFLSYARQMSVITEYFFCL